MADRYGGIDEPYEDFFPDFPEGHPDDGKHFAREADLTVYWPYVRSCWEEPTMYYFESNGAAGLERVWTGKDPEHAQLVAVSTDQTPEFRKMVEAAAAKLGTTVKVAPPELTGG